MASGHASWRAVGASQEGTSHQRSGTPCQDACRCEVLQDGGTLVAAVADGAGSARRAQEGSALAVGILVDRICQALASGRRIADFTRNDALGWLAAIRSAMAADAEAGQARLTDYSTTLLAVAADQDATMALQIGDGAIVVAEAGRWNWVFWPQRGEFVNETMFVTDAHADANLQFNCIAESAIDEVALFTDGIEPLVLEYANRQVHAGFFDTMMTSVRRRDRGFDTDLSLHLARYLASPRICERTDDDKTLVLATRRGVVSSG